MTSKSDANPNNPAKQPYNRTTSFTEKGKLMS